VAVGQRGHVLLSDDGGATWSQAVVPVSSDLTAVCFVTPERGFAVGHDGVVLATDDGGQSWARRLDGRGLGARLGRRGVDEVLLDVWFADARTGFAVGAHGLVLRTDDAGATWVPWPGYTENPRDLHLYAVRRAAGAVWAVGEQGLVLRLDPVRGRFAAARLPYAGSFFGVVGDERTVLAFGLRGRAFRSDDRGATWQRVDTGVEDAITGATEMPDGRLVLVTAVGGVLVSEDRGASFSPERTGGGAPASGVAPSGADGVVVVGVTGVSRETLP
jgi:photosystem II stability/assembly factor-like uncharacterized protein